MAKSNIVVAGDYKGEIEFKNKKKGLVICGSFGKKTYINKDTIEAFELVGEESHKSLGSGVARGIVGAALFGGIGAIAGASSAKSKTTHTVSIQFKDGTKVLCELDDAMYKNFLTVLY